MDELISVLDSLLQARMAVAGKDGVTQSWIDDSLLVIHDSYFNLIDSLPEGLRNAASRRWFGAGGSDSERSRNELAWQAAVEAERCFSELESVPRTVPEEASIVEAVPPMPEPRSTSRPRIDPAEEEELVAGELDRAMDLLKRRAHLSSELSEIDAEIRDLCDEKS
jgi:hypothetical protein